MKKLILISALLFSFNGWTASYEDCKVNVNKSDGEIFGSYEQLQLIQKKVKRSNCSQLVIFWENKDFLGLPLDKLILLDLDTGTMIRWTKPIAEDPSYELWHSFSKNDLLKDDPADGFDLPNYTTKLDASDIKKIMSLITKMKTLGIY